MPHCRAGLDCAGRGVLGWVLGAMQAVWGEGLAWKNCSAAVSLVFIVFLELRLRENPSPEPCLLCGIVWVPCVLGF